MSVVATPPGRALLRCPTCHGELAGDDELSAGAAVARTPSLTGSRGSSTRPFRGSPRRHARPRAGLRWPGPGLVRARRGGRRGAAVPLPRPRLGGPQLEGERALVRAAARSARAGHARARGRRREVLGRAARRRRAAAPTWVPTSSPTRRSGSGAAPSTSGRPVPPRPGRRREPAVRGRVVRRRPTASPRSTTRSTSGRMVGEMARVTRRGATCSR